MATIGERIRNERDSRRWSRTKLAGLAGISPTALSDLELGYTQRSLSLHRIADALGVNADWLETGKGEKFTVGTSQPARFDDATMAQAVELLYLMADARPEDKRFRRFNWAMILLAAKGIAHAEGDPRKAMASILADLAKET
jgi:transcriptional regulator with XRE-family HTH domain